MQSWLAKKDVSSLRSNEPHYTYRTATLSFLSMCSSLDTSVGACAPGSVVIRGLSGIVTEA